ncbi:MAG TPA: FAD-dependent oxidoreductase [Rectinemataceae bacterium]
MESQELGDTMRTYQETLPSGEASPRKTVIVVGAGLSGLTAACLLANRGLDITLVEQQDRPGGAASAFRRGDTTYDTGAAMMFGFGEYGFNPHNWLMAELGEPIEMYRHEAMYRLYYGDSPIVFHADRTRFVEELETLFPKAKGQIRAFYDYIENLYERTIAPVTVFEAPGDMPLSEMRKNASNGLGAQLAMVSLLFRSAESLIKPFVSDPEARAFFDKITSTYCYTTMRETPAVLAATMFVDNHAQGAYYPAGSAMALAARLEKALEARGGRILYRNRAKRIVGTKAGVEGIELGSGEVLRADYVLYSGSLRAFAENMDPDGLIRDSWKRWLLGMEMTMPSFVVYGTVDSSIFPPGTLPVQMFVDNKEALDEGDVTLYLPGIEDPSLAPAGLSSFLIIGPSLRSWPEPEDAGYGGAEYAKAKREEADRMLSLVEKRIPGFVSGLRGRIEASPTTIWRYLGKTTGSVAGFKQKMGQHLIFRQGSRGPLRNLFFAGESTVMGTGTPAVTVSGISAANRILRGLGMEPYSGKGKRPTAVRIIPAGQPGNIPQGEIGMEASRCRWCESAPCSAACPARLDIPGIMRRLEAGNVPGAASQIALRADGQTEERVAASACEACAAGNQAPCEKACILASSARGPVRIKMLAESLRDRI